MSILFRVVALGLMALLAINCCASLNKAVRDNDGPDPIIEVQPAPDKDTDLGPVPKGQTADQKLVKPAAWAHFIPTLTFNGRIDDDSAAAAEHIIDLANESGVEAILMVVDSGGGDINAGYKLLRAIEGSQVPVYCVVDGEAASMASALLQVCKVRLITERSRIMIHQGFLQLGGDGASLHPDDLLNLSNSIHATNRGFITLIAHRLCMDPEALLARTAHGLEWWLASDEANAANAVDGVVPSVRALEEQLHATGKAPVAARQCLDLGTLPVKVPTPKSAVPASKQCPPKHQQQCPPRCPQ